MFVLCLSFGRLEFPLEGTGVEIILYVYLHQKVLKNKDQNLNKFISRPFRWSCQRTLTRQLKKIMLEPSNFLTF